MRKFLFENLISVETGFPVIVTHETMPPRNPSNNEEDRKILEIEAKIKERIEVKTL